MGFVCGRETRDGTNCERPVATKGKACGQCKPPAGSAGRGAGSSGLLKHQASLISGPQATSRTPCPGLVELTPAAQVVVRACVKAGGRPLLIGGGVRDALLGDQHPKDIDIEVYGVSDADQFFEAMAGVGTWSDVVGKSFGVVKVRLGQESFDISLPRRDSKVGDGHRGFVIEVGTDMTEAEASQRRDFTVNTMGWDPVTEELVDCWGGRADLEKGVLRATSAQFSEDPLRVLRGMQFTARFGWRMDNETVATCTSLRDAFGQLATERVGEEWRKALTKGRHFTAMAGQLKATGWLSHFSELAVLDGLEQEPDWHPEGDVLTHSALAAEAAAKLADEAGLEGDDRFVIVAAALLHDFGKPTTTRHEVVAAGTPRITSKGHPEAGQAPALAFLRAIDCPERLRQRIVPLVAEHMAATAVEPTHRAVLRLARRLAPARMADWALVVKADRLGRGGLTQGADDLDRWLQVAKELKVEKVPTERILTGYHLIDAGWKPGREFKDVLAAAIRAQDDGEFVDQAGAIAWFRRNYPAAA